MQIDFKSISQQALQVAQQLQTKVLHKASQAKIAGPSTAIACDLGASKVVLMQVDKMLGDATITRFDRFERPSSPTETARMIKEKLQSGGYTGETLRISAKGQGVVVRFIEFPHMKKDELKSALTYEAENYIPFKISDVILDYHILEDNIGEGDAKMMRLILIAVKKEEILPLVAPMQAADLKIEFIDMDVFASINALTWFYPEDTKKTAVLVDIGKEISSLSVIHGGTPRFVRDISYGGIDVVKRLKRKLGIGEEEAVKIMEGQQAPSEEAIEVLKEAYAGLVADIKVSLDYYRDQVGHGDTVQKMFLSGGGTQKLISEVLGTAMNIPVQGMNILEKIKTAESVNKEELQKNEAFLSVAMGLCLR